MAIKHEAYLLLGGNISPRIDYLNSAKELVEREVGVVCACSAVYESEPWGFEANTPFLNQVLLVDTFLDAQDLLAKTQKIEKLLGRTQKSLAHYTSRTIDIDILFFDETVLAVPGLKIPHEQIQNRRFTLIPLVEIAPGFRHPILKKSCRRLLEECEDSGKVWKLQCTKLHEV